MSKGKKKKEWIFFRILSTKFIARRNEKKRNLNANKAHNFITDYTKYNAIEQFLNQKNPKQKTRQHMYHLVLITNVFRKNIIDNQSTGGE